jgi:TonB family protein
MTKSYGEIKGLLFSVVFHAVAIGVFLYTVETPVKTTASKKMITMDLMTLPAPEKVEEPKPEEPKPEEPKPEEPEPEEPKPEEQKPEEPKPIVKPTIPEKEKPITPKKKIVPKATNKSKQTPNKKQKTKPVESSKPKQSSIKADLDNTDFLIIRNKVLSHLKYPAIAKRMRWSGKVIVKLTINSSGKLINVSLVKSSGKKQLDDAALQAANAIRGQDLPKPQSTTDVTLPIIFGSK